jgi:hypothetical protein
MKTLQTFIFLITEVYQLLCSIAGAKQVHLHCIWLYPLKHFVAGHGVATPALWS